jgi:imidazole glycerol-phosphate synthase subunit HisH
MSRTVAIIDYGSGNLHSAAKAFERAARERGNGLAIEVTAEPEQVAAAERIVLPGVGAFADCKRGLARIPGMIEALTEAVQERGAPFLGICVGLQLMAMRGLEHGETPGLGWVKGEVRVIEPADPSLKIPHMGWNTLELVRAHPLFDGIPTGEGGLNAYFVHSYHLVPAEAGALVASTDYGGPITAFIAKDNMAGSQFHPEKSQRLGLTLIGNFLAWKP